MWFEEFKKYYRWASEIEGGIRLVFNKVVKIRLRDALGNARKNVRTGRPPPLWIAPNIWEELQTYWATDESFKKLSELGKRNRVSDNDGLGPPLHSGGSRSFKDHARKMISG